MSSGVRERERQWEASRPLLVPGVLALALTAAAAQSAWSTLERPFPSLLVDAYGFFSLVSLPSWDGPADTETLVGARLTEVQDDAIPPPGRKPPRTPSELYDVMAERASVGQQVSLTFAPPQGDAVHVTATLRPLGVEEVLFLFVTYALVAWLVLWSGARVLTLGGRPAARRAYACWSVVTFLFLLSFYDYHTRAWLAPLFSVSVVGLPLSALWLAYAFPAPPTRRARGLYALLTALTVLGTATALGLVFARFTGSDIAPVRAVLDQVLSPCIATLALAVLVRLRRGTPQERAELRTAAWGLIVTPLVIALMNGLSLGLHKDLRHLELPFVIVLLPLSIGHALIRHNILETRAVLGPRLLRGPLILGALLGAVLGVYLVHRVTRATQDDRLPLLLVGVSLFGGGWGLARRLLVHVVFPATRAFRGTIEGLGDRLASLRDPAAIRGALEEAVTRALPTRSAEVMEPPALTGLSHVPPEAREELARGLPVWTAQGPRERHLLVPMRSRGELRAVLCLAPKRGAAPYTQEDVHLLETMASLGALALHNTEAVLELESLRRLEVGAAHSEKRLTLSAFSEEMCHELIYPLSFLEHLLRRNARGHLLDEEDLSLAREEVERTRRMLGSLRRLQLPRPEVGPVPLLGPVQRALLLVRESIDTKRLHVTVSIAPELTVRAEADALVQLLSNLLRNAAQAAPSAGAMGIHAGPQEGDDAGAGGQIIEVWDTGPGIPEEVARVLFTSARISTKQEGYGIGLTVVQRIAYSFRWTITLRRESDRTLVRLTLPPSP